MKFRYNIAICDDDISFREEIHSYLKKNFSENYIVCKDFSNAEEILNFLASPELIFDFIFLDIEMPGMNGIELAKLLRQYKTYEDTPIIFASSYDVSASSLVSIHPYEYLLKPIAENKFISILHTLIDKNAESNETLLIQNKGNIQAINLNELLFIESKLRKLELHCQDNFVVYTYSSLDQFFDDNLTDKPQFVRAGKSFVVNLCHIKAISPNDIVLRSDITIPVSRTYRDEIMQKYSMYYHKEE